MSKVSEWLEGVRIAVIGLGYVGLPLAVEFGKKFHVVGYDVKHERIEALRKGWDETLETEIEDLKSARYLCFSTNVEDLRACNVFILTVPTPIDQHKQPDLRPLLGATETVASLLESGDTVIFESTVYPGCTEEDCVPSSFQVREGSSSALSNEWMGLL